MLEIGSSLTFIKDINALDEGLSTLKLHKIKINSENLAIRYEFISDRTINSNLKNILTEYVDSKTPKVFKTVEIDIAKIVADSVVACANSEGFSLRDRDVVAVTEAVVARAQGNYATVHDIANDVSAKFGDQTVGVISPYSAATVSLYAFRVLPRV